MARIVTFGGFSHTRPLGFHASDARPERIDARIYPPYFKSSWNRFDAMVIISYWIDLIIVLSGAYDIRLFRALSSLRPLRLLSMTPGLAVRHSKSFLTSEDILFR